MCAGSLRKRNVAAMGLATFGVNIPCEKCSVRVTKTSLAARRMKSSSHDEKQTHQEMEWFNTLSERPSFAFAVVHGHVPFQSVSVCQRKSQIAAWLAFMRLYSSVGKLSRSSNKRRSLLKTWSFMPNVLSTRDEWIILRSKRTLPSLNRVSRTACRTGRPSQIAGS